MHTMTNTETPRTLDETMTLICRAVPNLKTSQLLAIAEALDPMPADIQAMTDRELLEALEATP
jgi:hypothetical protein